MPKAPQHTLIWLDEPPHYDLHTPGHAVQRFHPGETCAFSCWVEAQTSFAFVGQTGRLSVRKEARPRGSGYWYAYYKQGRRTRKRYLGRADQVTFVRLEEVARVLSSEASAANVDGPPLLAPLQGTDAAHPAPCETHPSSSRLDEPGEALLLAKFSVPRQPNALVMRKRLLQILDTAFVHPLTLLSASAGWGKTTLLSAWVMQCRVPVAWLSLEEQDNDPLRFWSYVFTALRAIEPKGGETALNMLRSPAPVAISHVLTALIAALMARPEEMVLILDDFHAIEEPGIHGALRFLLDHIPPCLHLIIASRIDPPWPLARLRVRNQLVEIRDAELRFTQEEAGRFLNQCMGLALSAGDIERLAMRTEGWIASLQLAALALQKHDDPSACVQILSGSSRFLLEYVQEEILDCQPSALQDFLLQTSGLNRLSDSLCNAVTGRGDSYLLLQKVERANLFLQPLDDERQWYRYHALWASAIQSTARQRLGTATVRALYAKASQWYEQHGLHSDAVEAALQAEDFACAAQLVERIFLPQHFRKPYLVLRRWLEQIPAVVLNAHPFLSFVYAEALTFTSQRCDSSTQALCARLLDVAEEGVRTQEDHSKLAQVLSLKATLAIFRNELPRAFTLAHQMLELQPEGEQHWRGSSLLLLGVEALLAGKLSQARQHMKEAREAYEADQSLPGLIGTALILGEISVGQGMWREATQHYRQVLSHPDEEDKELVQQQLTSKNGTRETLFARLALQGLAHLSYERNELETAEHLLSQAQTLDGFPVEELHFLTHSGSLLQVRILHAQGQVSQAQDVLSQLAAQAQAPRFLREVRACQARLALMGDMLTSAEIWEQMLPSPDASLPFILQEEEALLLARLRIAQGKSEQALRILAPWYAQAEAQGYMRTLWEIQLVQARAHFAQNQHAEAQRLARHVLAQTKKEGYQRLFLDEGQEMEALLKMLIQKIHEVSLVSYVRTILQAFTRDQHTQNLADTLPAEQASLLCESLSPQEQRVLHLLVAGRTYAEIAQEFIVSPNTIKTQVSSIYRKLGVNRRAEAVALARQINLF